MRRMHLRSLAIIGALVFSATCAAPPASAFWGKKKSPEEQQEERLRKAAEEYNHGLDKMAKAKKHASESDSTFAFNYRATQNAKARKDYQRALEKFDKAIELNPEMYEAYSESGFCLRKLGHLDESLIAYETCLSLKPDYAPAIEYKGEAFLALNFPDSAQSALNTLQQLAEQNPSDTMFTVYQATLKKALQAYQLTGFQNKRDK